MSKNQWAFIGTRKRPCFTYFGIEIPLPPDLSQKAAESISRRLTAAIKKFAATRTPSRESAPEIPGEEWLKAAAKTATNVWRAERRIVDPETKEPKPEMKLLYRDINAIGKALEQLGVETIDPTDRIYDSGMRLDVVSFEPTPGLSKETIKETIKPSVKWQGRFIQRGEVIVGTPLTK
jgi:hypothetical protein